MSKLTELADYTNIDDPKEFMRHASRFISQLQDTFNGGLDFATNFNCQIISVNFSVANQDTQITHKLNRTGIYYIPISKSVSCDVYNGNTAQSKSSIYLRSTVSGSVVSLLLF